MKDFLLVLVVIFGIVGLAAANFGCYECTSDCSTVDTSTVSNNCSACGTTYKKVSSTVTTSRECYQSSLTCTTAKSVADAANLALALGGSKTLITCCTSDRCNNAKLAAAGLRALPFGYLLALVATCFAAFRR